MCASDALPDEGVETSAACGSCKPFSGCGCLTRKDPQENCGWTTLFKAMIDVANHPKKTAIARFRLHLSPTSEETQHLPSSRHPSASINRQRNSSSLHWATMIVQVILLLSTACCTFATDSKPASPPSSRVSIIDQEVSASQGRPLIARGIQGSNGRSESRTEAKSGGFFTKLASKVNKHFNNGAIPKRNRRNLLTNHQNHRPLKPTTMAPINAVSKRSAQVGSFLDWLPGRNNQKDDATDEDLEEFEDMLKAFVQYAPAEGQSSSGEGEEKLTEALSDYISDIKSAPDGEEGIQDNRGGNGQRYRPFARPAHGYQGERFNTHHHKPITRQQPPINLMNLSPSPAIQTVHRQNPPIIPINSHRPKPIPLPPQSFPQRTASINVSPIPRQLGPMAMASEVHEMRQRRPNQRNRQVRRHQQQQQQQFNPPVAQERSWSQPLAAPAESGKPEVTSYGLYLDKPPRFYSIVDSTPLTDPNSEYGTWVPVIPDSYFLETEARSDFILSRKDHIAKVKYPGALRPFLTPPPAPTQAQPLAAFKQEKQLTYANNKHSGIHQLPGVAETLAPYEDPALYQTTGYQQHQQHHQPLIQQQQNPAGVRDSFVLENQLVVEQPVAAASESISVEEDQLRKQILKNTLAQRRNSLSPHQLPDAVHFKQDPLFDSQLAPDHHSPSLPIVHQHGVTEKNGQSESPEDDTLFRGKVAKKMAGNAHYNRHKYNRDRRFDPATAAARTIPAWQQNHVAERAYHNPVQQNHLLHPSRPSINHGHGQIQPASQQNPIFASPAVDPRPKFTQTTKAVVPYVPKFTTTTIRSTTTQQPTTATPKKYAVKKNHHSREAEPEEKDYNDEAEKDYKAYQPPNTRHSHHDHDHGQDKVLSTTTHSQTTDWTNVPAFGFSQTAVNKNWQEPLNEAPTLPPVTGIWKGIDVYEPNQQPEDDYEPYYQPNYKTKSHAAKPARTEQLRKPTRPDVKRAKATTTVAPTGVAPSPTPLPSYTQSQDLDLESEEVPFEYLPKKESKKKPESKRRLHYAEIRQGNSHGQQLWPLPPSAASNPVKTHGTRSQHETKDELHGKPSKPSVLHIRGKYSTTRRQERKMNLDSSYPSYDSSQGQQAPVSPDYYDDYPVDTSNNQQFSNQPSSQNNSPVQPSDSTEEEKDEGDYNDYGTSEAIKELDSLLEDPSTAPASEQKAPKKKAKSIHTTGAAKYPFLQVYKPSSASGYLASRGSIPASTFESFKVSEDNGERSPVTSPGADLPEGELADYPEEGKQVDNYDDDAGDVEQNDDKRHQKNEDHPKKAKTSQLDYDVGGEVASGDPGNDMSKETNSEEDDGGMMKNSDEEDDESNADGRARRLGNMLRKFLTRT